MPGFQGLAQFQFDAADGVVADLGETELQMRGEPFGTQRVARGVEFVDHVGKILLDKMRQHEAIMQLGAPAGQFRGA